MRRRIRNRLNSAIRPHLSGVPDCGRGESIRALIGCSLDELMHHLEQGFDEWMDWSNRSLDGWHIDHIVPLASFDLTDPEQRKQACHYTNLQPMWCDENLRKGAKK